MLPAVEDVDVVYSIMPTPVTDFNHKVETLAVIQVWRYKYVDGTERITAMT
jgi:hypothetical protein